MTTTTPFTPTPFPYQTTGAIQAAWHGHTLIADEQGLGKTLQALLAARLLNPTRTLIICPPVLATNWATETRRTGNHPNPHTITSTTPTSTPLPETGYIITTDALIVARPTLAKKLANWRPNLLIADEAHRYKNYRAKRTRQLTAISRNADKTILLTGTPIISSPLDILPLLRILKKTQHFPREFIDYYTKQDFWGNRTARPERLPELNQALTDHVWTRRTKAEVLPDLPPKLRSTLTLTVDDTTLTDAMQDLYDQIDALAPDQIDAWAADALTKTSQLRRATGLAKIPAATEWITSHLDATTGRPLIAWCIHRDVMNKLVENLTTHHPQTRVAVINGDTPASQRDQIVTDFQAGRIDVLLAQIVAAGVGLTLTASTDVLFIETDWTPALVVQAEDRAHRIGTTNSVNITTLIAKGTLDPHIHATLTDSIRLLDQLTPGSDHHVTPATTSTGITRLLASLARKRKNQQ